MISSQAAQSLRRYVEGPAARWVIHGPVFVVSMISVDPANSQSGLVHTQYLSRSPRGWHTFLSAVGPASSGQMPFAQEGCVHVDASGRLLQNTCFPGARSDVAQTVHVTVRLASFRGGRCSRQGCSDGDELLQGSRGGRHNALGRPQLTREEGLELHHPHALSDDPQSSTAMLSSATGFIQRLGARD